MASRPAGPDASPAPWRGFCIDPAKPGRRLYLVPRGLTAGAAGKRAVDAGLALSLCGGPIAFDHVDMIEREEGGAGRRHARRLADVPEIVRPILQALAAPRPEFAGLKFNQPRIMGVINVTPDSFSDGGDLADAAAAIERGRAMLEAGADILDIGGESTRPGAGAVDVDEELRRVLPVIEALAASGAIISIDTRRAAVMRRAVAAGARIINDVTALTGDPQAEQAAADSEASIVLMHMQGDPRTMQKDPRYDDVTCDLLDYFSQRLDQLDDLGIARSRIAIDPGIGFGKRDPHNLLLLDELAAFHTFGCPVLLGASRKSFIGRLSRGEAPKERLAGTLAADQCGLDRGAQLIRVHDVAEAAQARAVWQAIQQGGRDQHFETTK